MAGGLLGKLYLGISGDTKPLRRDLNSAEQMVRGSSTKMSGSLKMVGAAMAGIAAFQGFRMLTDSMSDAIRAASDLEETTGKFSVVFKGQEDAANALSDTLVNTYKLSEDQAKSYLSSIQDMLVPMGMSRDAATKMSGEFSKLAVDLGSFNNLETSDVLSDITSALAGQYEPMRKYGVMLSATVVQEKALALGLATTKDELNNAHKAQAAYQLIVEGSSDALGDYIRTQDSHANQMREFRNKVEDIKAAIGEGLKDAVKDVVTKMNDWVDENDKFIKQDLPKMVRDAATAVEALAFAIGKLSTAYKLFSESVGASSILRFALDSPDRGGRSFIEKAFGREHQIETRIENLKGEIKDLQGLLAKGGFRKFFAGDDWEEQITRKQKQISTLQNELTTLNRLNLQKNPGDAQWSLHHKPSATEEAAERVKQNKDANDQILKDDKDFQGKIDKALKAIENEERQAYEERKKRIDDEIAAGEQMTDVWLSHYQEREEANERAMEEIKKNVDAALDAEFAEVDAHQDEVVAEYERMQEEVQKIWDNLVENVQRAFGDSFYRMFDEGIKGFDDFFDQILDMFKRLLADMVAAWMTKGIIGLLKGTFEGFSIPGLSIGGESLTKALGGTAIGKWAAGLFGGGTALKAGTFLTAEEAVRTAGTTTAASTGMLSWGGALLNPATIAPAVVYGMGELLDGLKSLRGKKMGPGDWLGFYDAGMTDAPAGWRTPSFKDEAGEWTKNFQDASGDFVDAMRRTFEENGNRFSRIELEVNAPESIPLEAPSSIPIEVRGTIGYPQGGGDNATYYSPPTSGGPSGGGDNTPSVFTTRERDTPENPRSMQFGGPVFRGEDLWVGEGGPERFVPNQDGHIIPNHMLNGGSTRPQYFTINVAGQEFVSLIREVAEDVVIQADRRDIGTGRLRA